MYEPTTQNYFSGCPVVVMAYIGQSK